MVLVEAPLSISGKDDDVMRNQLYVGFFLG